VPADDRRHDGAAQDGESPDAALRARVFDADHVLEVQGEERKDRVDAHDHEGARGEGPEEVAMAKRGEELAHARDA
jgi:hypothetical protein